MARQRLRVVHVTQGLDMGGQEKLLVEFARHVDRDRFDLRFVSLSGKGPLARDLEDLGWPVDALEMSSGLRPVLVYRLARLLYRCRADVLHTHNNRPLVYGALATRVAGVRRFIHTRHGQSYGITPRQVRLVSLAARCVHRFVCVSRDCARLSVAQLIPGRSVGCVWNGIDAERFSFLPVRADGPALLVARLSPEKDIETLLRACALVAQRQPEFRLRIAGDGPCRGRLEALAGELGIRNQVRFLGMARDVPELLAQARFFVLSSVSEGVSLTLLEAMARGLPVAATRVGGNPEVVDDGVTGLLVPPRDPQRLAEAMLALHGDAGLRGRMGRAARERIEAHFTVGTMVERYQELWTSGGPQGDSSLAGRTGQAKGPRGPSRAYEERPGRAGVHG